MINFNPMNAFNEINLKISFGSSGSDQEQSVSLFKNSGAPPPPNGDHQAIDPSGSEFSLPPPPGFSSEGTTHSSSQSANNGGEGPPPPNGPGDQRGTEISDLGPPEASANRGSYPTGKDFLPHPPEEENPNMSNKKSKGKS